MEANSVDPEQTAPRSSLIWVHTVCHRGFLNISADEKSRQLLLRLAHLGLTAFIQCFVHARSCDDLGSSAGRAELYLVATRPNWVN